MSAPPVLVIDDVTVRRGGRVVIRDLSVSVAAGEIVAVTGSNGVGKSTLLAAAAGVLPVHQGIISVGGSPVWRRKGTQGRRALGYAPEAADAPGHLTAGELWALCAAARGCHGPTPALRRALVLDELASLQLDRMSLGQRRRTCLAAAFVGPPRLLLLDEPDNGLAPEALDELARLIADHAEGAGATLIASHDIHWLTRLGARIVPLSPP